MRNERKRDRKGRRRKWIPDDLESGIEKWYDWSDDNGNDNDNEMMNDEGR